MAGKPRYTVETVVRALTVSRGLVSVTARRLGCDQNTVRNYLARHEACRQAMQDARDQFLDGAEARLIEAVEVKGDLTAIMFTLKTVGKSRGYVERIEQTGADGKPIETAQLTKVDLRALSDEELAILARVARRLSAGDPSGTGST